jgi:uncharacterized damage-inducible protein DinB
MRAPRASGAPQEAQLLGVEEENPDCIEDGLLLVCEGSTGIAKVVRRAPARGFAQAAGAKAGYGERFDGEGSGEMPTIAELLLPEFDAEMVSTRKVLGVVPEEKFSWRPHAKSFTMQALAGHVAELSSWTSDVLRRERFEVDGANPPENASFKPASVKQMLEKFEGWAATARADLAAATDDAMQQEWVMTWDGYEIIRMPRYHAIRKWSLNHLVHHRAQLGVYLRLNDVKLPGVYGPSADDQPS